MAQAHAASAVVDSSSFKYVVGVDIGSQTCRLCVLRADKSQVMKPTDFVNAMPGFVVMLSK